MTDDVLVGTCAAPPTLAGRCIGVLFALLLASTTADMRAQSAPATPFRVSDAIAMVRANHPLLAAAGGRRMAIAGTVRQEGAFTNPTLEYRRENLGSTLDRDIFFTLYVPVDLAGRRLGLRAAGRSGIARAVADSMTVARQVEVGAVRAYWRAALAGALLDVAVEQRTAFDGIAEYTATKLREGATAEQAAIRTRLEADRARIAEGTARAEWQRARASLAQAVGAPASVVPMPPALAVLTSADLATAIAVEQLSGASDSLVADALMRRSEVAALQAALRQAGQRLGTERRSILTEPVVQLGTKKTGGIDTRVIGIGMPLPVFAQNGGARERARGEQLAAEADLREVRQLIAADVIGSRQALAELVAAAPGTAVGTLPGNMTRDAADIGVIAEAAYREGGSTLLELLEARRASVESRAVALRWTADIHLALLDYRRALGTPLVAPSEAQ